MAWPKGRKRAIAPKPSPDIAPETAQILGHPVQSEATSAATPVEPKPALTERQAANYAQMLCYIRGEFVPRHLRIHWDQRNVPIVDRVRAAMLRDRAKPDQAEAYLDAELARR